MISPLAAESRSDRQRTKADGRTGEMGSRDVHIDRGDELREPHPPSPTVSILHDNKENEIHY